MAQIIPFRWNSTKSYVMVTDIWTRILGHEAQVNCLESQRSSGMCTFTYLWQLRLKEYYEIFSSSHLNGKCFLQAISFNYTLWTHLWCFWQSYYDQIHGVLHKKDAILAVGYFNVNIGTDYTLRPIIHFRIERTWVHIVHAQDNYRLGSMHLHISSMQYAFNSYSFNYKMDYNKENDGNHQCKFTRHNEVSNLAAILSFQLLICEGQPKEDWLYTDIEVCNG